MKRYALLLFICLGIPSAQSAPSVFPKESEVRVSERTKFKISAGWSFDEKTSRLVSPEADVTGYLLERPYEKDLEALATKVWKEIDPKFSLKIGDRLSPPPKDGWDEMHTFVYDVPRREEKIILTEIHVFKDRAYLLLLEASYQGFEKRKPQLDIVSETWRPYDLKPEDLSGQTIKKFSAKNASELDRFIIQAMKDLKIPGAAVAVVQDQKVVYRGSFGVKKLGSPDKVSSKTLFMIGSVTKPLTTLMLGKLVDAGKISWETPIQKILPAFTLADKERAAQFLMKHAACACTGMPRADNALLFGQEESLELSLRQLAMMKPITGFGETFQYSNQLVSVGGMAGGEAYGHGRDSFERYEQAMQDLVFDPLGMKDTRVRPKAKDAGQLASPHAEDLTGRMTAFPQTLDDFAYAVAPAGSVWSNVDDMVQYLIMELNEGKTADGASYISAQQLMMRRMPGVKVSDTVAYGLGLFIANEQGISVISHGGNTLGFTADMAFLPEHKLGVVVLMNAGGINAFKRGVRQKLFEQLFSARERAQSFIDYSRKLRDESAGERARLISLKPKDVKWIEDFIGDYQNEKIGRISIRKKGDDYYLKTGRWESRLGSETREDDDKGLALVSPPWSGTQSLSAVKGPKRFLVLDDDQFIEIK